MLYSSNNLSCKSLTLKLAGQFWSRYNHTARSSPGMSFSPRCFCSPLTKLFFHPQFDVFFVWIRTSAKVSVVIRCNDVLGYRGLVQRSSFVLDDLKGL